MLGAHKPIHEQRHEHDAFVDADPPAISRIEYIGLRGPHGTIPVRVYHPSRPATDTQPALIYMHGGGFIVGSLDQFDTAMRRLCEGAGVQVYAVDYKLAPNISGRCRSKRASSSSAGCSTTRLSAVSTSYE